MRKSYHAYYMFNKSWTYGLFLSPVGRRMVVITWFPYL